MNRTKGLTLVLALSTVAAGCDDEFLTTLPPDQVSGAVFWQQQKDAELAANALYNQVQGEVMTFRMEAASDNAWAQKSFDAWYPIGQGIVDPNNGVINDVWNTSYRAIRRANEILANIDRIPQINAGVKSRVMGEAHFHRAYHYLRLAFLYGDVPLILKPISIEEGKSVTRTAQAQVVDQIIKDLDAAAPLLPVSYGANDVGRATRGAALAYKARTALYAKRWQVAAEAAKAVMDLKVYSLHPRYQDITRYGADDSNEIIFADRREKGVRGQGVFGAIGPRSLQGGSDVTPLRELVDAYQIQATGLPITNPASGYDPSQPYANRDPRMYATLLYPGATYCNTLFNSLPGSKTPDEVRNDFNATSTGFQFIKYVDCADRNDRGNSGVDLILMRYADVLLMYAEAKIELNQIDVSVLEAINAVRTRAGMPPYTMAQLIANPRGIIRYERRVEFALEGLRLFDIRRWGIAEQVMPGQKYGIDYVDNGVVKKWIADTRSFDPARDYRWPIPQRERDLNPSLTQNPGY